MGSGSPVLRAPSSYKPLGKPLSQRCVCETWCVLGWRVHLVPRVFLWLHWIWRFTHLCLLVGPRSPPHPPPLPVTFSFLSRQQSPCSPCWSPWKCCFLGSAWVTEVVGESSAASGTRAWGCVFASPCASVFPPVISDSDTWPARAGVYRTCLEILG